MADSVSYVPSIVASISVADFEKALAWYTDTLGLQLSYRADGMDWAEVQTAVGGFTLGISGMGTGNQGDNVQVTLGVADIDAARATLESRGVEFTGPTDEMSGMVKLAQFKDPDGNTFMLAQTLMEAP